MKETLFIGAILLGGLVSAQTTKKKEELPETKKDSISYWNKGALFNLGFSQVSLSNWSAGGNSSVSGNAIVNLHAKYKKGGISWDNTLNLGYGLLKQDKSATQKSDDNIELNSKFGKERTKQWSYAALINFNSQFTDGYDYPNDSTKISTFLAPGYLYGALGMDYKPTSYLSIFLSPITSKTTIVTDTKLSEVGAFGVDAGEKIRSEFGGYVRANITKEIMKNIKLTSTLALFSNYIEKPENVDINWEMLVLMKVNKFVTVSINTKLIYDHDINITKDTNGDGNNDVNGPRTQFKEILSVGLSYKL
jgi:hypothetical protein